MKPDLLFSIVIPSYNRADSISATIQSVMSQTYPNFELIVVDDGSTDQTEHLVNAFKDGRIRYFKKANAERGAARNYGTQRAQGDYITFLDSDDIVYPDLLALAIENINSRSSPAFFHMGFEMKDESNTIIGRKHKIKNETRFSITNGNYISCIAVFLRKDIASQFQFREDVRLSGSEDWELWLRIVANAGVQSDHRVVACFTQHDDRSVMNISEEKLLMRKNLSFQYAFLDPAVMTLFSKRKKMMEASFDIYIALHLALAKLSSRSFFYLHNAIFNNPALIFEKRFYAVVKQLLKSILFK